MKDSTVEEGGPIRDAHCDQIDCSDKHEAARSAAIADILQRTQDARSDASLVREALDGTALTQELWLILELLDKEPQRLTEISARVFSLKGSVSRWLATLSELGLVSVGTSTPDRRSKIISLTASGSMQLQAARQKIGDTLLRSMRVVQNSSGHKFSLRNASRDSS